MKAKAAFRSCPAARLLVAGVLFTVLPFPSASPSSRPHPKAVVPEKLTPAMARLLDRLPLHFEANTGQTDGRVKFLARAQGYRLFLTDSEAVVSVQGKNAKSRVAVRFLNADPRARITGMDELPGVTSYFLGNDPSKWRARVKSYVRVRYESIYPGVDLVFYGQGRQLEYDFVVAPGADPGQIAMKLDGGQAIIQPNGDLAIKLADTEITWRKPQVYQRGERGERKLVAGNYEIRNRNEIRFALGEYRKDEQLVIDPTVVYATALGGTKGDFAAAGAVDGSGNLYVLGGTESLDFPVTQNAEQPNRAGDPTCHTSGECDDLFVSKLDPTGSTLIYSTYVGGSTEDRPGGITVDTQGNAIVTGYTISTDFPVRNALQRSFNSSFALDEDGVVFKLNPDGTQLVFSTYLGGKNRDFGYKVGTDKNGSIYVFGRTNSLDFPFTPGAFSTTFKTIGNTVLDEFFLAKFDPDGHLLLSTLTGFRFPTVFTVDPDGFMYFAANGTDMKPTPGAYLDPNSLGGFPMAVAKMNQAGSGYVFVAYVGDGVPTGVALDPMGNIYVVGQSFGHFTTTPGAFESNFIVGEFCDPNPGGDPCNKTFAAKLDNMGGVLLYATYLRSPFVGALAVTQEGKAYTTISLVHSQEISPTPDAFCSDPNQCNPYGLLLRLSETGSKVDFASYPLAHSGASPVGHDSLGNLYLVGIADPGFVGTSKAFQSIFQGGDADGFAMKVAFPQPPNSDFSLALTPNNITASPGQSVTVQITTTGTQFFDQPIALTCSGLPADASCAFSANPLIPNSGSATSTLTIKTSPISSSRHNSRSRVGPYLALCFLLFGAFFCFRSRGPGFRAVLAGVLLVWLLSLGGGCAGTLIGPTAKQSSQNFNIVVNAVASSVRHSATVSLTVQQ